MMVFGVDQQRKIVAEQLYGAEHDLFTSRLIAFKSLASGATDTAQLHLKRAKELEIEVAVLKEKLAEYEEHGDE